MTQLSQSTTCFGVRPQWLILWQENHSHDINLGLGRQRLAGQSQRRVLRPGAELPPGPSRHTELQGQRQMFGQQAAISYYSSVCPRAASSPAPIVYCAYSIELQVTPS